MVLPEVSVLRSAGRQYLTANAVIAGGGRSATPRPRPGAAARVAARVAPELEPADPHPTGESRDRRPAPARALRGARRAGARADRRRRDREGRAGPRGRSRGAGRARPGGGLRRAARAVSRPASASAAARPRRPSSAPAPSCWSGARAPAPRRSRSPARPGAAPTRRSTTISASGCCRAPRTARSTRSSPGGSSDARARTRSGSRPRPSPGWSRSPTSSTWRPRSAPSSPSRARRDRARRPPAPDPGGRRRARRGGGAADRRARGPRPRLVRGAGGLDGRGRGRRVLRGAALRAAARPHRAPVRGRRDRRRLRSRPPSWPRPRSSSARCCRWSRGWPGETSAGVRRVLRREGRAKLTVQCRSSSRPSLPRAAHSDLGDRRPDQAPKRPGPGRAADQAGPGHRRRLRALGAHTTDRALRSRPASRRGAGGDRERTRPFAPSGPSTLEIPEAVASQR